MKQISCPHNGAAQKLDRGDLEKMTLVEVGPRFCLNPIKIFGGSFGGPALYENPFYVSPNQMERGRHSVDVGNLQRNRKREIASTRSTSRKGKGKARAESSFQSRDDFETDYQRRDGMMMSEEELQHLLSQNDLRFAQEQQFPTTIDEEELEDDNGEEDAGGDGTPDDEQEDEGPSTTTTQIVGDDFDVLKWWKENERTFPILSKMAKQVLAMPISTVAVEQEFSAAGNILTDYRTRLSPSSLETLVCFHDWLKAQRRTQEITITPSRHFMEETTKGGESD
ncbi:unnamed protein product [Cuscuta europaea]|uniref:HAT C-terminal dimerisation domain-containing protein n=2 Tax=Cuscuta europaea TaxID=41803 RepID=A0A9P0Z2B8_CUSEU|nr:unnamed protein product [Cuscuta europaea]